MKNQTKTITVSLSDNTMEKMTEYFQDSKREKTPPYAVFQADEADTVVTLYQSGKAVFQGISADIDANIWIETEKHLNPDKNVKYKTADNNKKKKEPLRNTKLYYCNSIGSDEVGTGDYFGPVVVAAAYVKKEDISFLEDLGVKDSKTLTDQQILKMVPQIIKKIPYSCMVLSNQEYNSKYSDKLNLNAMKARLHNKVLLDLNEKYKDTDYIVVDQFVNPSTYYKYIKDAKEIQKNITFITKAENQNMAVACGALISRYVFIKEIDKLSQSLGVKIPKGAGTKVDEVGAQIVKTRGIQILNEIAKYNFKNTDKIKDLVKAN